MKFWKLRAFCRIPFSVPQQKGEEEGRRGGWLRQMDAQIPGDKRKREGGIMPPPPPTLWPRPSDTSFADEVHTTHTRFPTREKKWNNADYHCTYEEKAVVIRYLISLCLLNKICCSSLFDPCNGKAPPRSKLGAEEEEKGRSLVSLPHPLK